ncbi:hypothetical protein [Acaryochloris sp. IP29b_bin.148]|uniref:hypothetical protein n=1 Tax=Acaryochloris sp. IP29b_bin.148 TaxID=2969218 RepID=UPI002635AE0D|nr:hypothetical protein [Acaryochloris sp. IP29b_bin.148]
MGLWHLNLAINPMQTILERWLQSLADSYPALSWMVAHPLLAVLSLLVVLAIVQILLGWLSSGIKHLLFSIVKSPYSLVRWLLEKGTAPLNGPKTKFGRSPKDKTQDQVISILKRLNHHQQEQDKLLKELKSLLPLRSADALSSSASTHDEAPADPSPTHQTPSS